MVYIPQITEQIHFLSPERFLMTTLKLKTPVEDIINYFDRLDKKIFTRSDIDNILTENKAFWRISDSTTLTKFIAFLLEKTKLELFKFEFSRNILLYAWGHVSPYELIASIKPGAYFSHYTAMQFHELTDQIPNMIYLNFEQPAKPFPGGRLTQSGIDIAFKRPVRVSKNIASFQDKKIRLLNGKYTNRLGVVEMIDSEGGKIPVTNIERTLIDIAVRPVYSGGIFEVLNAYKTAAGKVSLNKLAATLKRLDYIYPYHQVIGFYLTKAGVYKKSLIDMFKKGDIKYDFYLAHQMKDTEYSKEWRLYFPKGL